MIAELLVYSRQVELRLAERSLAHRLEFQRTRKVERLERQLAVARARAADTVAQIPA